MMRLFGMAIFGATLVIPLGLAVAPAHAQQQGNGLFGQAQRLLNDNNQNTDQRAYEQGRIDQQRAEQERRRENAARGRGYDQGYSDNRPRYPEDSTRGSGGPYSGDRGYNNGSYNTDR